MVEQRQPWNEFIAEAAGRSYVLDAEAAETFEAWQITERLRWRNFGETLRLEQAWMSADGRLDWRAVPTVIE